MGHAHASRPGGGSTGADRRVAVGEGGLRNGCIGDGGAVVAGHDTPAEVGTLLRGYDPCMVARYVAAAGLVVLAGTSAAQVFKCVDAEGRTTYQQSPCAKGDKGARVELAPDNGRTQEPAALEAKWAVALKAGQVVAGMPKRLVRDAFGAPTEVRAGTTAERVSEIWIYRNPGGVRRIGFLDGRVAWEGGDDASSTPPATEAGEGVARGGG